jgi:hypothetical protein
MRSQWPRGLIYEPSSPSQTLGYWVRILLKAWMFAFILFSYCPVHLEALMRADPLSKESYRLTIKKLHNRGQGSSWTVAPKNYYYYYNYSFYLFLLTTLRTTWHSVLWKKNCIFYFTTVKIGGRSVFGLARFVTDLTITDRTPKALPVPYPIFPACGYFFSPQRITFILSPRMAM